MAAPYPSEPFAQADDLLTGLIESYRSSSDAADMAYIQNVVDNVVKTAQDREFRVQDSIKELTQRVASAEAAAVYDDARAQHEQHMREINGAIAGVQQEVQELNNDVRGANDQRAALQQKQKQLQQSKRELARLQAVAEPEKVQRISLYVHISGLVFDYATLGKPTTTATISDRSDAEIRSVSFDNRASAYDKANMLWEAMDTPELQ